MRGRGGEVNGAQPTGREGEQEGLLGGPLCNVVLIDGVFTAEDCATIRSVMANVPLLDGQVNEAAAASSRQSKVRFIEYDPTVWIFSRLDAAVAEVNRREFRFQLYPDLREGVQYSEYSEGGHYGWHVDIGGRESETRKLSLVVQLNEDYEGGELDFFPAKFTIPKKAGLVVAFPAFTAHRVAPVVSGVRYSLATWAHGPARFM